MTNERDIASACLAWQRRLAPSATAKGNLGDRAALRRATSALDVCMVESFYDLRRALPHVDVEQLSLVAASLAHVDNHDGGNSVARQLAGDGQSPPMQPLRFQRLLQTGGSWDERHRQMVRLVRLLDGRVNVEDLSRSILSWDHATRRRWALDYFELVSMKSSQ